MTYQPHQSEDTTLKTAADRQVPCEGVATVQALVDALNDARGNINPERGFAEELEADIDKAFNAGRALIEKMRAALEAAEAAAEGVAGQPDEQARLWFAEWELTLPKDAREAAPAWLSAPIHTRAAAPADADKWPTKPLKKVQVTMPNGDSALLVPERAYFSSWAVQEMENQIKAAAPDEKLPQAPRQLTDERIDDINLDVLGYGVLDKETREIGRAIARAIEAEITKGAMNG